MSLNLTDLPELPQKGLIRDAYNRPLGIGDRLILTHGHPSQVTIVDIKTSLDPNAPPSTVQVMLQQTLVFYATRGKPILEVVRIQTAEELQAAQPQGGVFGTEQK